ncbi:exodeoxyribonuclease VII small subunit [Jeotgalibaca sp. PTS2502]|jgi:exodeoxyribonuclease VII small subunit|uniref:Exodeoxyribonuclease 7 small subunit n=2 Tax=Jeotgalibaca TaxID=1470540 RepID=A0A6G7KCP8_9LACT|nr:MULTISPECIES: exodeoxyribonuclease VII small subunit [Jeotgalibaca]APZ48681.1 exodeoxyribonuclease VII small subunit [Jeotgalibaca sp. PTS2502]QII83002.1 exodeoxyribonuclease VII small subunit [Jeotgalibaca arthritidis]HJA90224.1 exodeoxyribonuclease VII small subunit [Candidatus Jeotgalibaca merdavium]
MSEINIESLTFEQAMKELETIVTSLESGDVALEDALKQFQEGMALSKHCQDTLNHAERTLTKMIAPDGSVQEFDVTE